MNYEMISVSISAGALIFSGFAFFYSRKYKKIEKRLNELEIKKIENEQIEFKKAYLTAEFEKIEDSKVGGYNLKIKNEGKAIAKNIKIEKIKGKYVEIHDKDKLKVKHLDSNKSIKLFTTTNYEADSKITVKLCWEDEFSKNNKREIEVPL